MSGWPKPDEQADWSEVERERPDIEVIAHAAAAVAEAIVVRFAEIADAWADVIATFGIRKRDVLLMGSGHSRPRSKAMRKADQQRSRAVAQIEKELHREAQREAGGSWS